jgi:DNA (cytosine-5)-methyltransferase 1
LISDSISPSQNIELWVTSSGTAYAAATLVARMEDTALDSAPVWDDVATFDGRPWRGVVDIIHGGYPCQPFSSPDSSAAIKTRAISGHTSPASCSEIEPSSVSLKTSAVIYDWGSNKSMMTFDQWVTVLRRACLQRKKSARPTSVNGFSSWPTATATDAHVTRARSPEKMIRKDGRNVLRTPSLAETVMQPKDFPYTKQDLMLAQDSQPYRPAKIQWTTPRACNGERSSGLNRTEIMRQWATPTARDWKDGTLKETNVPTNGLLSRQAPRTDVDGKGSCAHGLTLNPLFVECADGLAYRVDRLRLCGNGVVPLVAAYAFRTLAAAAHIEFNGS